MFETHEQSAEIPAVLINAMILGLDVFLLQEPDHFLLQLSASFSWNDLDDRNALFNGFINNIIQGLIDFPALVVNFVKIEFEFCHLSELWVCNKCKAIAFVYSSIFAESVIGNSS